MDTVLLSSKYLSKVGLAVLTCLTFGFLAVFLGKDVNLDFLNYHYYNAYSFLEGRLRFDIIPAHVNTFINPTIDIPFFLLSQHLPGVVMTFMLGSLHGLNTILLYRIAKRILEAEWALPGRNVAWLSAVCGTLGAGSLALLGTTFYDNVYSIFILLGLNLILAGGTEGQGKVPFEERRLSLAFMVGLCIGIALGLKLTNAIYAVGICGAILVVSPTRKGFLLSLCCGLGVLTTMLLVSGHWLWTVWSLTGNPFFPWLNNIFPSPLADVASNRELTRLPKSALEAAFYPLFFSLKPWILGLPFRDLKILTAYFVLPTTVAVFVYRRFMRKQPDVLSPETRFLFVFMAISYVVWITIFGTYRYAITMEFLSPLVVVTCIVTVFRTQQWRRVLVYASLSGMLLAIQPGDWGRREWGDGHFRPYVQVSVPESVDFTDAMVLLPGWYPASQWRPNAFVIPELPANLPFIRISSMRDPGMEVIKGFDAEISDRISRHTGPLYVLFNPEHRHTIPRSLAPYGKVVVDRDCVEIRTNASGRFLLCPVTES